jgi:membrane protease YdiL (CAAX protease family)
MSFLLIIRRTAAFIRTCFPADPSSWLLLLGATFLFVSHSLRWWPQSSAYFSKPVTWGIFAFLMSFLVLAAGATACYLGLLGVKNPARRLLDSVLLPVAISLLAIFSVAFFCFRDIGEPAYFVSQLPGAPHLWEPHVLLALAVNLGTGFQFASIGFILVAAFFVLYSWGRATLPIHLPPESICDASASEDEHRRTMRFVWMMVAIVFLAWVPTVALATVVDGLFPHFRWPRATSIFWFDRLVDTLSLLVFVVLAVGKRARKMIPAMLRIPRVNYLAMAIVIPVAIAYVGPLASYLHSRMLWTVHFWGKYDPPLPSAYFGLPNAYSLWYFAPALAEEIAWRGFLQPRFVRRYGLARGIFLVGVVWGAFHFFWDFNSHMTAQAIGIRLVGRLIGTICLSYALAWLTIRSESILPAAVAHASYNAFLGVPSLPAHNPLWLTRLLWAIAGFVLFHFFPLPSPSTDAGTDILPAPEPEPSEV